MNGLKVLVTGAGGFVGRHLVRLLLARGAEVVGIGRSESPPSGISHRRFAYVRTDLCRADSVRSAVAAEKWAAVYHLAAENRFDAGWDSLILSNVAGTAHLLEALAAAGSGRLRKVVVIGSAQEYPANADVPLTEAVPPNPGNPYGWSKHLQTQTARWMAEGTGLPLVVARTFNLMGPEARGGVVAYLVRRIVEIERGWTPPEIWIGETGMKRDYLDVRDAAAAYVGLAESDKAGGGEIFNVCRGEAVPIAGLVGMLKKMAKRPFILRFDPSRVRKGDPPVICGCNRKLSGITGWKPKYSIEQSLKEMLDAERLRAGGPS